LISSLSTSSLQLLLSTNISFNHCPRTINLSTGHGSV
jgi:hypothetical protein